LGWQTSQKEASILLYHIHRGRQKARRGVAAAELAILLPVMCFLFVVSVDFARVFYYTLTLENCARNGALWASDPFSSTQSSYTSLNQAVLADASNLSPALSTNNISSTRSTDANGNSAVTVTVSYSFNTITNYPGITNPYAFTRSVEMRQMPTVPANFPP
jgi:Flp pilus assembly protein TadG